MAQGGWPSAAGQPQAREEVASAPPATSVQITEADRVAWMRHFLGALEQWKSALDSMVAAPEAPGRPPVMPDFAGAVPAVDPTKAGEDTFAGVVGSDTGDASASSLAVFAATQQAQQAQYLQQYQFMQQMRIHDSQRYGGKAGMQMPGQLPTRFKENFRPMRICKHLVTTGVCRQGEQCTFAHNYEELHHSSPDLPKIDEKTTALAEQNIGTADESKIPDLRLKKKKELCGRFARGHCSLGKVCSFAHGEAELNTVGLSVCGKVKTQLCRNFEAGRCIYGPNCNNAHGEQEIGMKRPPPELAPPMYKRKRDEDDDGRPEDGEQRSGDQPPPGEPG